MTDGVRQLVEAAVTADNEEVVVGDGAEALVLSQRLWFPDVDCGTLY